MKSCPQRKISGHEDIKNIVTTTVNTVFDVFSKCFMQLLKICKKHVAIKGDYFEGK
jgi:hypothetical protein